nr:MAG: adenylate kinase [Thermoproteus sp. AZ2]
MRILITGTPGVGKTTICRLLAARLGVKCIGVAELLAGTRFTKWDPYSMTYDVVDVEGAREMLREVLVGDHVVETHAVELLPSRDYSAFVLRKRPDVLLRDLSARPWPRHKILDNVWAEVLDHVYVKARELFAEVHQIDVTHRRPEDVVAVIEACALHRQCVDEEVDWLEYAASSGLLDELEGYRQ